jgi:hypothetical protein
MEEFWSRSSKEDIILITVEENLVLTFSNSKAVLKFTWNLTYKHYRCFHSMYRRLTYRSIKILTAQNVYLSSGV